MAEAPAEVWLAQVRSDYQAARRVLGRSDHSTYCQAVAKCQQVVEKSIKAVVAALRDRGTLRIHTGRRHQVEPLVSALIRLASGRGESRGIQKHISDLLAEHRRGGVFAVCALAPKWPRPGEPFPRNTEYPFQQDEDTWRAPADEGVFGLEKDVQQFQRLADDFYCRLPRIISAIEREPS